MRVVIAGGSGLLGRALTRALVRRGSDVVILTRRAAGPRDGVRHVVWTPDGTGGPWADVLDGADAVVNLAGAGIADRRWTPARKALLRSSRVDATTSLARAVSTVARPPGVFVQGSAVGYYGSSLADDALDESSPAGSDFLGSLAVEWERAAAPVAAAGSRLVVVRTGIVLSREGGALPEMARPFRWFVGGPIGTGRQVLSWIAVDDWVTIVEWCASSAAVSGAINATAPEPVSNAEFSRVLARTLGRPNLVPVPSAALRLLFGELAEEALLRGQRAVPARALELGFRFQYPALEPALRHVLERR